MKRYIKIGMSLLSLFTTTGLSAQQTGKIVNGFNVGNFPEVSFVYHSYNPDVLKKSDVWYLKEAGTNREFNLEELPVAVDSLPQSTLILWEDMAHNGQGQFDFTQKVLSGFFSRVHISASDKFAVSAFNRRKNTVPVLIDLTNGFTSDKAQIVSALQNYKHSTERYPEFPNRSDMYTAIRESLESLAPRKGVRAIIVFTAGYSMKNSGADSEAQVLLKAQQLHIPVYIFQYYDRSGVAPESEGFAKSTFGTFNSYREVAAAETALIDLYPQIGKRYQGHDYKITFTSDAERGSEARMIAFSVGGVEIQEQILPPSHTLWTWMTAYPWWIVLFVVLLIAVAVGLVLFIRRTQKNTAENRQELEALEQRRIRDKEAAEQYQRDQECRAQQEREQQEKQVMQAEVERLQRLMSAKNLYPRLKCRVGPRTFTYEIDGPKTRIGRDSGNDLVLNDTKVSRHHAEIVFNGIDFEIIDQQSTNKVIVNGRIVERSTLKSGDIIGLGEVVITFYN